MALSGQYDDVEEIIIALGHEGYPHAEIRFSTRRSKDELGGLIDAGRKAKGIV
jgi:hypothetical protein